MTTSCSSSVSVPIKSTNTDDHGRKSCDSVCTTNSSCYLQRRKPKNPLMYSNRTNYPKFTPANSAVRQRVLSAKLLKLRSIQSQLNDANFHLSELSKENQILKNLQKRQDKALTKYENTNADLPRLIRSHEEQLRTLIEKSKVQRNKIRELSELLKQRDEELLKTQERLTHLERLSKDKRLVDKEKLLEQIDDLRLKLQKADEYNSILNRKLVLESKTSKQRLNNETMKVKQTQRDLQQALTEVSRLSAMVETKENVVHPRKNRFSRLQSVSMVTLGGYQTQTHKSKSKEKLAVIEDDDDILDATPEKAPVSNIKLEPIKCRVEEPLKKTNGIMNAPSESIKNRLSSGSKSRDSLESNLSGEEENCTMLSDNGSEVSLNNYEMTDDNILATRNEEFGNECLEKLDSELDAAFKKAEENVDIQFEKKLGNFCSDIMINAREISDRVEVQKESLKVSKNDTNTILETFEKTKKYEKKLKKSFLNFEPLNDDFLNSLVRDKMFSKDNNGNLRKETKFGDVDRKKLLQTLKAIDDNESLDGFGDISSHNKNFSREIDELIG